MKRVSSNKTSKYLPHFIFTWPHDSHLSSRGGLCVPKKTHFCAWFYIASQLLIHVIFPTWHGWLEVMQSFVFFLHACGWAPLLSNFWDEKHACEPKARKGKRFVASTSRCRTVVATLLNSISFGTNQTQLAIWCLNKKHVHSDCSHPNALAPTPWAPLKPRDGPRESSRIDLKEGVQFTRTWVGCGWIVGGDVWCGDSFEVDSWKGWNWNMMYVRPPGGL